MGLPHSRDRTRVVVGTSQRFLGLVNFGNTCYCNSILQALYFCKPFRYNVLKYKETMPSGTSESLLLNELANLFYSIHHFKKKSNFLSPKRFYHQLKAENELFRANMQQDAQELLNYILNTIAECVQKHEASPHNSHKPQRASSSPTSSVSSTTTHSGVSASLTPPDQKTWVHDIFEGVLTSETRCLSCETVRTRDESFLDLSLDIDRDCSISSCLRSFSNTETLSADSKYFCETCCSKQEAEKRMRVKHQPKVLAIHLKRFKYMEQLQQYTKLDYRVVFPKELRLFNATDTAEDQDRIYDLFAIVVHIGTRPSRGHYVTIVRSDDSWVLFDDDVVEAISEDELQLFFGRTTMQSNFSQTHPLETAYILFYETRGLPVEIPSLTPSPVHTPLHAKLGFFRRHTHTSSAASDQPDGDPPKESALRKESATSGSHSNLSDHREIKTSKSPSAPPSPQIRSKLKPAPYTEAV
eukprot:m.81505 g.81505  ORF g.81505 m.81505 type:complete len:469 (-) comp14252_c1_seq3:171-1577(-)